MTDLLVAAKHILVLPHKDKAIELQKNVDEFRKRFVVDLMSEVRIGQGLAFVPIFIVRLVWTIITATIADGISNVQGGLFVVPNWPSWRVIYLPETIHATQAGVESLQGMSSMFSVQASPWRITLYQKMRR